MPHDTQNLIQQLRQVVHFRHLPTSDLEHIISGGHVRRVTTDETLFAEGGDSAGLFVLLSGRIHLFKLSPEGQQSILAEIEPVIMFNEVPALDAGPNAVTARSVEASVIWHCKSDAFKAMLMEYPTMALGLLRVLARRNRFLVEQFEDLSFRSVLARSAKLLLELSDYGDQRIDRLQHPNTELAARVSTVPEAFSRALRTFKDNHYIEATRIELSILQPDALADLAQISPPLPYG